LLDFQVTSPKLNRACLTASVEDFIELKEQNSEGLPIAKHSPFDVGNYLAKLSR
jgi:hypothetical protein